MNQDLLSRRTLLKAGAVSLAPSLLRAKTPSLNVLFIMSDQHARKASGCYGNKDVRTPNIDSIASAGTRFDSAYCQAPVCVPSRGSIVTGVYPHKHGARILEDTLPADIPTVAHFFKERGYATGAIGKMHFVDESLHHGFDHRLGPADFLATLTSDDREKMRADQGSIEGVAGRASSLTPRLFQDTWYADETVRFLRENRTRPFCLWSSFNLPHTPLVPMKDFFDLYSSKSLALPRRTDRELVDGFPGHLIRAKERGWYTQTEDQLRQSLAGYYGNISQMDSCVGRVWDTLRELRLDKNTLVVYTADHGEMAGAHRMWTKHNMFEESVGVPLLMSMPDRIAAGAGRNELIEQVDLFPTLTELCGFGVPKNIHGRSFAPLLEGRPYTPREFAYSEYYFCRGVFTRDNRYVGKPPILMVRTKEWKLNYLNWDRSELYHVRDDPGEFTNRIDDPANAPVVREMTAIANRMYRS